MLPVPKVARLPARGRRTPTASRTIVDDPYRYLPTLGEVDLHLINEGRHEQLWKVLGAHVHHYDAASDRSPARRSPCGRPHAKGVRVKGDFNSWDGREHPMRQLGVSGVWELFVPGVGAGARYKYDDPRRRRRSGARRPTRWPTRTEVPPATSSVVFESALRVGRRRVAGGARRARRRRDRPMSVYEVHLGSWRRDRSYRELADELVDYVADLGFTHVELMPVMEHPFGGSWGYQVTSYFAPTARFGDPDDLRLPHRPAAPGRHRRHPRLGARRTSPRTSSRWRASTARRSTRTRTRCAASTPSGARSSSTSAASEVRNFLVANALYWLEEFHADGLRVDAVASMLYLDYGRARRASGRRTSTAAARTSRRSRSSRR